MVWKSESEGAVWEWAKDVVSKAATRTAGKRKVVFFIRDPFFTRDMPPDSTCERGRWFRDRCSFDDDAGEPQVSPLRWLRCAPGRDDRGWELREAVRVPTCREEREKWGTFGFPEAFLILDAGEE